LRPVTCDSCGQPLKGNAPGLSLVVCAGCRLPGVSWSGDGSPAAPGAMNATFPRSLSARYSLRGFLGRGSHSTVYLAEDHGTRASVAIKFLSRPEDPASLHRFLREARILSEIRHTNVVRLLEVSADGEVPYYVSEYVPGGNLEQYLSARGPLSPERATSLARHLLSGLHALHLRGIVHRDLKPANVLLSAEGAAKLCDLGLAKDFSRAHTLLTQDGVFIGSVLYAAPEQFKGVPTTVPSDLYSVGMILYQMLKGRLPYDPVDVGAVLRFHDRDPGAFLDQAGIPPSMLTILKRMLARLPGDRPASAEECALSLRRSIPSRTYRTPSFVALLVVGFVGQGVLRFRGQPVPQVIPPSAVATVRLEGLEGLQKRLEVVEKRLADPNRPFEHIGNLGIPPKERFAMIHFLLAELKKDSAETVSIENVLWQRIVGNGGPEAVERAPLWAVHLLARACTRNLEVWLQLQQVEGEVHHVVDPNALDLNVLPNIRYGPGGLPLLRRTLLIYSICWARETAALPAAPADLVESVQNLVQLVSVARFGEPTADALSGYRQCLQAFLARTSAMDSSCGRHIHQLVAVVIARFCPWSGSAPGHRPTMVVAARELAADMPGIAAPLVRLILAITPDRPEGRSR
jgi:hypothetical protein